MRYNYWSCSKFAAWLRSFAGVKKPKVATRKEWKNWREEFKSKDKFIFWFTEKFLNKLQNFIFWPKDKLDDLYYAINARFKDRYFGMSSDLNKWQYHEIDTRILHCNFQTLVDFVESESAHMGTWKDPKKYGIKWYHRGWFSLFAPKWSNKQAGLDHLNWEMNLRLDEDWFGNYEPTIQEAKDNGTFGQLTGQALKAKEIYDLYIWWTETRPARPDPFEESGVASYYKDKDVDKWLDDINEPISKTKQECYEIMNKLEEQYEEEDTEMLIKLIKIRNCLWT